MAVPSGLALAAIILLTLFLFALKVGLFWGLIRMGESEGHEEWQTPPISREQVEFEKE